MAMHTNAPDDCLLVRHWVLLGEKSIPQGEPLGPGDPASPAGRARWLRCVGGGGGQRPKYLLCLAGSIRRRCCCGCRPVQGLGGQFSGGQQLPRLHAAASGPAAPGRFVSMCRRLFCAGIGSAAWPYVNELSPSDPRLGTRDTEGCSRAPVPGFAALRPGSVLARGIAEGLWWWRVFSAHSAWGSISCWHGTGAAAGGEDALG